MALLTARMVQTRLFLGLALLGYLGMSHDENLNAWFDEEGVTVRPTVAEKDRDRTWQLGFKLKGYGHGTQLLAAPPVVKREVKDNRIEYVRTDCQLPIAKCRFEETENTLRGSQSSADPLREFANNSLFQSAIGNRHSAITEWYENRRQGIEQGFTIRARAGRSVDVAANEPLRLELALTGDLRARVRAEGREIELVDQAGRSVLSYGKLSAVDADGKLLYARMEAGANGREIALVVDDESARYPITIDPIVATLEQMLGSFLDRQTGAQSGWAVAIDGNHAVVGAPTYDVPNIPSAGDAGSVSIVVRVGVTWSVTDGQTQNGLCGYAVAIRYPKVVWGCPAASSNTGTAFLFDISTGLGKSLNQGNINVSAGNFFGARVAVNADTAVVGAPFFGYLDGTERGAVHVFEFNGNHRFDPIPAAGPNDGFGISVALSGDTLIVGAPGVDVTNGVTTVPDAGAAYVFLRGPDATYDYLQQLLVAADPHSGIRYGANVAISGNTAVVAASADGDKGHLAGPVYVFVRTGTTWSQQQKLTGNDTKAGDRFGFFAVAIEGNTI